jgi:hypothetical protein
MTMIEIARFADVYEAEIAASRLRADGYDPVLGGAEHVKTIRWCFRPSAA